tara:strand:- start:215 stop:562 length:348 start_codon:yes stop_codon:yes gene_type:complete
LARASSTLNVLAELLQLFFDLVPAFALKSLFVEQHCVEDDGSAFADFVDGNNMVLCLDELSPPMNAILKPFVPRILNTPIVAAQLMPTIAGRAARAMGARDLCELFPPANPFFIR